MTVGPVSIPALAFNILLLLIGLGRDSRIVPPPSVHVHLRCSGSVLYSRSLLHVYRLYMYLTFYEHTLAFLVRDCMTCMFTMCAGERFCVFMKEYTSILMCGRTSLCLVCGFHIDHVARTEVPDIKEINIRKIVECHVPEAQRRGRK